MPPTELATGSSIEIVYFSISSLNTLPFPTVQTGLGKPIQLSMLPGHLAVGATRT